jgi:hypothetical protein
MNKDFGKITGLKRGYAKRVLDKLANLKLFASIHTVYKVAQGKEGSLEVRKAILEVKIEMLKENQEIIELEQKIKALECK